MLWHFSLRVKLHCEKKTIVTNLSKNIIIHNHNARSNRAWNFSLVPYRVSESCVSAKTFRKSTIYHLAHLFPVFFHHKFHWSSECHFTPLLPSMILFLLQGWSCRKFHCVNPFLHFHTSQGYIIIKGHGVWCHLL